MEYSDPKEYKVSGFGEIFNVSQVIVHGNNNLQEPPFNIDKSTFVRRRMRVRVIGKGKTELTTLKGELNL